ncbi:hypothetical protein FPRO04_13699 [Fusarium proliferatum]|nr:hypothetical protein FPRO04_13699 [Fusarium proliferatum]
MMNRQTRTNFHEMVMPGLAHRNMTYQGITNQNMGTQNVVDNPFDSNANNSQQNSDYNTPRLTSDGIPQHNQTPTPTPTASQNQSVLLNIIDVGDSFGLTLTKKIGPLSNSSDKGNTDRTNRADKF